MSNDCEVRRVLKFLVNVVLVTWICFRAILQHAIPLISTHGFTRKTLSLAVMQLPTPHLQPLPETAITALFGNGDEARKTLINGWLKEGLEDMKHAKATGASMQHILKRRLQWNQPVLEHLPEARIDAGYHFHDVG